MLASILWSRVVHSDVSSPGYGGYVIKISPNILHGHWSLYEATIYKFNLALAEGSVCPEAAWFTVNQNVVRIVQVEKYEAPSSERCHVYTPICLQHLLNCRWNRYLGPRTNLQIMLVA